MHHPYSFRSATLAQLGGALAIWAVVLFLHLPALSDPRGIALLLALLQGGIAAIIAQRQRAPVWWILIHLGFMPLIVIVHHIDIEPNWFLGGFLLLLLIFWRTDKSQVPLYLTNRPTAMALAKLIPPGQHKIIDLGCGEAGLLRQLALARPECTLTGIEHAPLPWLAALARSRKLPNVAIRFGNFWDEPLGSYQLVYAFLSPAPMQQLWDKLRKDMAEGALFVTNSFPVPGVEPIRAIEVKDRRLTRLYLYVPNPVR